MACQKIRDHAHRNLPVCTVLFLADSFRVDILYIKLCTAPASDPFIVEPVIEHFSQYVPNNS